MMRLRKRDYMSVRISELLHYNFSLEASEGQIGLLTLVCYECTRTGGWGGGVGWESKASPISEPSPPLHQGRITSLFCNRDDRMAEWAQGGQDMELTDLSAGLLLLLGVVCLCIHVGPE